MARPRREPDPVPMPDSGAPAWTPLPDTRLGGWRIVTASRAKLVAALLADHSLVRGLGRPRGPRLVFDANGHALALAASDPVYRAAIAKADLVHADGGFLVSLSRVIGPRAIEERSATTDLIHDIAGAAARAGLSFYLLGGTEAVNAECAHALETAYPGLRVAGRRNGYFVPGEAEAIVRDIEAAGADVVWVGLGKPAEQIFAAAHGASLSATWLVTCGGCFNFITGAYRRAPEWMQRANLEWLHRMLCDPRRLAWRYLVTSPRALWLVLTRR